MVRERPRPLGVGAVADLAGRLDCRLHAGFCDQDLGPGDEAVGHGAPSSRNSRAVGNAALNSWAIAGTARERSRPTKTTLR
ncbi:hypothetical protein ACFYPT_11120 [Streptomyces sp. NPDC005529]|uniref:hypothetical protein n=1 Tax=unclassified Streptomyces TaxID=2593676 RepID=UPI0033A46991